MDRTKSIQLLNKALNEEVSSTNQYMYFHFKLSDLGYDLLASLFKRVAIVEMTHSEDIAERVFFLEGDVVMAPAPTKQIHDVKEIIQMGIDLEIGSINDYNNWAQICGENKDSATKRLFEELVQEEEKHLDIFQTELANLEKFKDNYLALQSLERTKAAAQGTEID